MSLLLAKRTAPVTVTAALAWTEQDDVWSITGTVSGPTITAALAWVEQDDVWAITGTAGNATDTHDGGHWKRKKDAKYGDEAAGKSKAEKQARRAALDEALGVVFPKPVEEPEVEPPPVVARPAPRIPVQKSKGIVPTEPDAIDLRLKQMEEDEQFVIFIATQLH